MDGWLGQALHDVCFECKSDGKNDIKVRRLCRVQLKQSCATDGGQVKGECDEWETSVCKKRSLSSLQCNASTEKY